MKKTMVSALLLALLLLLTGCACKHEQTHLVNAAAATCTAAGYTGDTVCDACEETVAEGSAIAALGHEPGERTGEAEPTCTDEGYTGDILCAVCGAIAQAGEAIPAAGHSASAERAHVRAGTCTQAGYTGDVLCSVCGEVLEAGTAGELGSHVGVTLWAVEATCLEDGYTGDIFCDYCDLPLIPGSVISAPGHQLADTSGQVMATCTRVGSWGVGECANCGEYIDNDEMAMLPHSFAGDVCSVCGWLAPGLYQDGQRVATWDEMVERGDIVIGWRDEEFQIANPSLSGTLAVAEGVRLPSYSLSTTGETGITSLYLPATVRSLPEEFLRGEDGITELRMFGEMTVLGGSALAYSSLPTFEIPDSTREIRELAFHKSKIKNITIPASVESMEYYAFSECGELESVVFEPGSKLTEIPKNAFEFCTKLKRVVLGENITSIHSSAFTQCTALEELVLPAGVQTLRHVFTAGKGIKTVYFRGTQAQWDALDKTGIPESAQVIVNYAE